MSETNDPGRSDNFFENESPVLVLFAHRGDYSSVESR